MTDDFLRAYLLRPEIRPVQESGPAEAALHERLLDEPRRGASAAELEAIEDADARDNYRVLLAFFRRLLRSPTVEACYSSLFAEGDVSVPPLFIDQLAQIIVRNVLDGCEDPLELRAAELFFREQKASVDQGTVMLADLETVDMHASGASLGALGRLIVEARTPLASASLDVLEPENAAVYWQRDQRHDLVIAFNYGRPANRAFCRVLEKWLRHFFALEARVAPVRAIEEADWAWHIGLDAQSTALMNDLWRGGQVEQGRMRRLLALFRLDIADGRALRGELAGRAVYLALSMDEGGVVRMKPQNLLVNLPLRGAA